MGKLTDGPTHAEPLKPGESRTFNSKAGPPYTVHRTARPYVYDLCDAYNANMLPEARQRGLEWYVGTNNELRIGTAHRPLSVSDVPTLPELEEHLRWLNGSGANQVSLRKAGVGCGALIENEDGTVRAAPGCWKYADGPKIYVY